MQALKQYPTDAVVLIDVEHAYDKAYGDKLGLKSDRFWYSQPDSGDQALAVRPVAPPPAPPPSPRVLLCFILWACRCPIRGQPGSSSLAPTMGWISPPPGPPDPVSSV